MSCLLHYVPICVTDVSQPYLSVCCCVVSACALWPLPLPFLDTCAYVLNNIILHHLISKLTACDTIVLSNWHVVIQSCWTGMRWHNRVELTCDDTIVLNWHTVTQSCWTGMRWRNRVELACGDAIVLNWHAVTQSCWLSCCLQCLSCHNNAFNRSSYLKNSCSFAPCV